MPIPRDVIDRIYATAKVEEVVGDYVTLKKKGANLWGLCPFHNEKTPSFSVSPSKGIYKCFGCGKAGNAVNFVAEMEQCSYPEAIKRVAAKYHIEVPERELTAEEQQRQDDRESMFIVNEFASKWFQDQLWNTDEGRAIGLKYFIERGLHEDTIKKFQLGYSPERGNKLTEALKKKGFLEKYIINDPNTNLGTGLTGRSEDGRLYDRFRDRVIFPVHTVSGKTVAFAGRILRKKDNTGKYVNSPDSIIYSKSRELYGLFLAKQAISKADLCYLVEGQMDLISMYQAGIQNVVCSGGTALTKQQIQLIHRFTGHITVIYDGDAAGIHAALRGIDMFLEENFDVKVVLLPEGEDPDSFCRSHNASDFIEYIRTHQTDFIRFKTQLLKEQAADDPHKRSELIKDIIASIALIPDVITRQVYIKDTSDRMQINAQYLTREVARLRHEKWQEKEKQQEQEKQQETEQQQHDIATIQNETLPIEENTNAILLSNFRNLIQMLVRNGEQIVFVDENGQNITVGDYILSQLKLDQIQAPTPIYAKIIDEYEKHCHDEGFSAASFFKFHEDPAINSLAIELIADQYQLSNLYREKDPKKARMTQSAEQLAAMVIRLVLELKYTIINLRLDDLDLRLREAQEKGDEHLMMELLKIQPQLFDARNQISKELGERLIFT